MNINALGFIEARGLIAAIVAADAMVKAANVKLIRQHQLDPRCITLVVEGDLAACRAAVDAGVAAASRVGEVVSRLEIGRPDGDTGRMVLDLIDRSKDQTPPAAAKPAPPEPAAPKPAPSASLPVSPPAASAATAADNVAATASVPVVAAKPLPAPQKPAAAKTPAAEADNNVQPVLDFIAANAKGRSWSEIVKRFPDCQARKAFFDDMVKNGRLRKSGNRYLSPTK